MSAEAAVTEGPMQLSDEQCKMFDFALGHSWAEVMSHFGIRSKCALRTMLKRTALGFYWVRGYLGGNDSHQTNTKEPKR